MIARPQTLNTSAIIARAFQIEALQEMLAQARHGRGQCLLVIGEAGVGKTRLIREFRESARETGVFVLQGNCLAYDRTLPFAPITDALRRFLATQPSAGIADLLGAQAPELVKLLPELSLTLPNLKGSPTLAHEVEKQRLFEILVQFLARLATPGPLLLVIEDIHWSDDTSLEFLHTFARRARTLPVFMVLTFRPETNSAALERFLAQLNRERFAQEMRVQPLSREAVDALLRTMLGWEKPVNPSLLSAIYTLTEGNPFFVEEVVNALVATGDLFQVAGLWQTKPLSHLPIPHSLNLLVQQRTNQLSPPAIQVLALAAVAGYKFDFAILAQLTAQDEDTLLALIKELVALRLVVEETPDQFNFRHALTREAIYSGLLSRERHRWHTAMAAYYENQEKPKTHLSELAYHCYEAGMWEKALQYGRMAGLQAQQQFAPYAALTHFGRVAEVAARLGLPLSLDVLRQRGQAYQRVGNFEAALTDFETALKSARALGDHGAAWQALYDLGFLWMARDYTRTGQYLREALVLARTLADPATLAHSLNRLGNWTANVGRPLEALALHEEALAIFKTLDDPHGLGITHDLIATAHGITGNIAASTHHYQRACTLFEKTGDRQGLASSLTMLTTNGAIAEGERAVALAREIGWRDGESYAHLRLANAHAFLGEIGAAFRHCMRGLDIAREIDHALWQVAGSLNLALLSYFTLTLDQAEAYASETLRQARMSGAQIWAESSLSLLVLARLAQGNLAGAAEELAERPPATLSPESLGARYLTWAFGEMALAQANPAQALDLVKAVFEALPHLRAWEDRTLPILRHVEARAWCALGGVEQARAAFTEAIQLSQDYGFRPLLWRCYADFARLHLAKKNRAEAEAALAAARLTLAEVAATIPDMAQRHQFQTRAEAYLPAMPDLTPLQHKKHAFGGLTRREQQVAVLVAQGKSNKEIAVDLYISVYTVKTHLTSILTKLNLTSRLQIATWINEKPWHK